jgi:hypothetical protein
MLPLNRSSMIERRDPQIVSHQLLDPERTDRAP